jgi:hypothetical protein
MCTNSSRLFSQLSSSPSRIKKEGNPLLVIVQPRNLNRLHFLYRPLIVSQAITDSQWFRFPIFTGACEYFNAIKWLERKYTLEARFLRYLNNFSAWRFLNRRFFFWNSLDTVWFLDCAVISKILNFFILNYFFIFLDNFNRLTSKINFKK